MKVSLLLSLILSVCPETNKKDVVKFAGDACMVVWAVDHPSGCSKTLEEATYWAARCACCLHQRLRGWTTKKPVEDPVELRYVVLLFALNCLPVSTTLSQLLSACLNYCLPVSTTVRLSQLFACNLN